VGSNDEVQLCVSGGSCSDFSGPANILNLYQQWKLAEFNMVGFTNGSQAQFNSGTSITVQNVLADQKGNAIAPSAPCPNDGQTGESNNLNLGACSVDGSSGKITFPESNAKQTLTTGVDSGSGSVKANGSNCPSGCSEASGSSVTVNAKASSGWQFSSWSTQTGISCTLGLNPPANPCTFSMPGNAVTLKATFIPQLETMTVSYTIRGGGSPSAPTFNYVEGGVSKSVELFATPTDVQADFGSSWSVTPNPISGSLGEQWITTQATSGRITGNDTLAFKYQHQYYLGIEVNPSGAGSTKPSSNGWYNAGQNVPISATANYGYAFLSWSGTGAGSFTGTSSSSSITMNGSITEAAHFGIATDAMTVSYTIHGGGQICTGSPPFQICTPSAPTFNYVEGGVSKSLILTTTPTTVEADFESSWSVTPNPLSGSDASERWIAAEGTSGAIVGSGTVVFKYQNQYYLTMQVNPGAAGTAAPYGWNPAGQTVTIHATAYSDHKFKSWKGTGTGSYTGPSSNTTITMDGPITETANFT
jgi:hypothetical protein